MTHPFDSSCAEFRARLEHALVEGPDAAVWRELSWQEHLFTCSACRELLAAEEALELLLSSLPEPTLPADLTQRVLARLAADGATAVAQDERALDRLLARDRLPSPPAGLAANVLAGIQARLERAPSEDAKEVALDRLLERVPAPVVPARLAQRVLAQLEPERARRTELVGLSLRWTWAAAAVALVGLGLWIVTHTDGTGGTNPLPIAVNEEPVDDELLAALDVLENWDLLVSDDIDLLLAGLGPMEELAAGVDPVLGLSDPEAGALEPRGTDPGGPGEGAQAPSARREDDDG